MGEDGMFEWSVGKTTELVYSDVSCWEELSLDCNCSIVTVSKRRLVA